MYVPQFSEGTHHHLADGLDDVVHLGPGNEAVVIHVVQPERPCQNGAECQRQAALTPHSCPTTTSRTSDALSTRELQKLEP